MLTMHMNTVNKQARKRHHTAM